jgi:hypothetical protein
MWALSCGRFLPRRTIGYPEKYSRAFGTIPVIGVLESQWDLGSSVMEARILRPLVWFGLLESRTEPRSPTEVVDCRLYRKAPLFDRFLEFDVQIEGSDIRQ